jgi:hypothetical protein
LSLFFCGFQVAVDIGSKRKAGGRGEKEDKNSEKRPKQDKVESAVVVEDDDKSVYPRKLTDHSISVIAENLKRRWTDSKKQRKSETKPEFALLDNHFLQNMFHKNMSVISAKDVKGCAGSSERKAGSFDVSQHY